LAASTSFENAAASLIASSESIFLFISIPESLSPFINLLYDIPLLLAAALILAIQSGH